MKHRLLPGVLIMLLALTMMVPATLAEMPAEAEEGHAELSEDEATALLEALDAAEKALPEGDTFRIVVSPDDDLSVQEGLDPDWQHILLMGTDTGNKTLNYGRTDAMMIASFNAKTKQLKLTSLVRDMLVDIPGLHAQNRINTANWFGGPLLAIKTVNEVMGLNITRYVSINFIGFSTLINTLGGVEIELSAGEASELNIRREDGPQMLDGKQALEYVRIRKLDNNFGRNERQRNLLEALYKQVTSLGINDIISLMPHIVEPISTNLSTIEIMGLLPMVLSAADGPAMLSLPPDDAFRYYRTADGASVVVFDEEATKNAFSKFIDYLP